MAVATAARSRPRAARSFRPSPVGWAARGVVLAGRRLARARVPAVPAGDGPHRVHDGGLLRDRRPVAQRAARLRRPDLARPPGVRRHRRVRVGVHGHRAGPVVLGRRPRRRRRSAAPRRSCSVACRCACAASTSPSSRCRTDWSPSRTSSRSRSSPAAAPGSRRRSRTWFDTEWRYYYLCLAFLAVVLYLDWMLMRSRAGRALLALRENPRVAATFGIDVRMATLFAFVLSGVFAGLAGALIAHNDTFVSPDTWDFNLALVFVIMTVVGGLRSRTGPRHRRRLLRPAAVPHRQDPRRRGVPRRHPGPARPHAGDRPARHRAAAAAAQPDRRSRAASASRSGPSCAGSAGAASTSTTAG